jgi:hypothetical protein
MITANIAPMAISPHFANFFLFRVSILSSFPASSRYLNGFMICTICRHDTSSFHFVQVSTT